MNGQTCQGKDPVNDITIGYYVDSVKRSKKFRGWYNCRDLSHIIPAFPAKALRQGKEAVLK